MYQKAKCAVCGEEYGEVDTQKHPLAHVAAVAATTEAECHTEYWLCESCHKYFSDKDGNRQIALADTVIAKLAKTNDIPTTSPSTGVKSHVALWLAFLLLSGGALIGRVVYGKKKSISPNKAPKNAEKRPSSIAMTDAFAISRRDDHKCTPPY